MPPKKMVQQRGGVKRVRTKTLPDGTVLRVYVFNKSGPHGGRTWAEKVQPKKKGASRGSK